MVDVGVKKGCLMGKEKSLYKLGERLEILGFDVGEMGGRV